MTSTWENSEDESPADSLNAGSSVDMDADVLRNDECEIVERVYVCIYEEDVRVQLGWEFEVATLTPRPMHRSFHGTSQDH